MNKISVSDDKAKNIENILKDINDTVIDSNKIVKDLICKIAELRKFVPFGENRSSRA